MQPPTKPRARSKMPLLPAETIFAICDYFTVDPHNPGKGYHVSLSARDNIRTLRHLSLTCRAIHDVVTPVLYSSVYFTGPVTDPNLLIPTDHQNPGAESLVYFLRTMVENAELRQHVQGVTCLIDLRDTCHFNEEMNTVNKDYGILSTIRSCKEIRTKQLLHRADSWIQGSSDSTLGFEAAFGTTSRRPIISISHQLFASVACLLPNLTSMSLRSGSHLPCYPRSPALYEFKDIGILGRVVHTMTQHIPLENLTTLQVQCKPESTIFYTRNPTIHLLDMVPVLRNAPNLTQVRCYGCDSTWTGMPATMRSFEGWGPVPWLPFLFDPIPHLKSVVIHLSSETRDFMLRGLSECLGVAAPALEHLEVSMSPGAHCMPKRDFPVYTLWELSRLQSFCFDTRLFSEDYWAYCGSFLPGEWTDLPYSIETLRIVDSEPRHNPDTVLNWLLLSTRLWPGPEQGSKLKRAEYLHMPPVTEPSLDEDVWRFSKLEIEVKQELALRGVQFQLLFVDLDGNKLSAAEFMKQHRISTVAWAHDVDVWSGQGTPWSG